VEAINWHSFFFLLFGLAAGGFALAVVLSGNIVRMGFYLIMSLGAVAGLFFLAGAEFVGAMQLMIYVGGTMVLLVFGVMLTARGPFVSMKTPGGQWVLATIVGGSLLVMLLHTAVSVDDWRVKAVAEKAELSEEPPEVELSETTNPDRLGMALVGVRSDQPDPRQPAEEFGMSGYLLAFEIVSVHLLVVLIGAAYLARTKRVGSRD